MKSSESNQSVPHPTPVVAIGSTDGAEAVANLLKALPAALDLSYVYVQEAGGDAASTVANALKDKTRMPVELCAEGVLVEPNHFYVLPVDLRFKIEAGAFVTDTAAKRSKASPVNLLFTALAESHTTLAIGVLLSAFDSEGATGLKAIKMGGGISFVQHNSDQFPGLPRNLIAEGIADFILPAAEIAEEISRLAAKKELLYTAIDELNEGIISNRDENLLSILWMLNRATGVDFSQYKMNTIKRRIIRRMMLFKMETLKDYAQYIRQHTHEVNLLYQDLLINVTTFFRDAESSQYVQATLLPQLLKGKPAGEAVRIWVPACSTGQEPYSLAMLLTEALGDNVGMTAVQIFATDLSESAVNKARSGIYTKGEVADIPPQRLNRFFQKIDGHYRIVKSIRDLCVFATHNITKDPPFSRLDLISCCNLLIYLNLQLQAKLIATFHYSLAANGYLILGKSETVGSSSYLFGQVEKRFKIYAKKKDTSVKAMFEMNYRLPDGEAATKGKQAAPQKKAEETDLEKAVDFMLLKRFTPASVLVNADLDILQFRGSTGLYLEPSPGKASLNLMKMARPGLGFELRNAVHKAKKNSEPVRKDGVELIIEGKPHRISIEALPIKGDTEEDYFLVVFQSAAPTPADASGDPVRNSRVKQLEAELTALREDMRSIVESQEAANEELQSANEEIVSSNEELQSINEELETSKEEIESSNEELITINQELQMRNEQLAESQEYSDAVFTTTRESLLLLDRELRVKTANAAFYNTFRLREAQTEGVLLFEVAGRQWDIPKLREVLSRVLTEHGQVTGVEIQHTFPGIGEKTLLLNVRSIQQKIHGQQLILLAVEDATAHRDDIRTISQREAWFRQVADETPAMMWVAGPDGSCTFANQACIEFRGIPQADMLGKPWYTGAHPEDAARCARVFAEAFRMGDPFELTYRLQHYTGEYRVVTTRAKPNSGAGDAAAGYLGSCIALPVDQEKEGKQQ